MNWCQIILVTLVVFYGVDGIPSSKSLGQWKEHHKKMPLEYIGSFEAIRNTTSEKYRRWRRDLTLTTSTSHYFKSQNAAGWSIAREDCINFLGEDASLLGMETEEEFNKVNEFLQSSDDTGSTYWVGAEFDVKQDEFMWEGGVPVELKLWDSGHPESRTPVTKVIGFTVGGLKLRTRFSTESTRYICELKTGSDVELTTGLTISTSTEISTEANTATTIRDLLSTAKQVPSTTGKTRSTHDVSSTTISTSSTQHIGIKTTVKLLPPNSSPVPNSEPSLSDQISPLLQHFAYLQLLKNIKSQLSI